METQQYETVWSGATWRDVATPAPAPVIDARRVRGVRGRTSVLQAVGDVWISTRGVVERSGLSERRAWGWLVKLVEEGRIERMTVPSGYNVPQHLYRQRQETR